MASIRTWHFSCVIRPVLAVLSMSQTLNGLCSKFVNVLVKTIPQFSIDGSLSITVE